MKKLLQLTCTTLALMCAVGSVAHETGHPHEDMSHYSETTRIWKNKEGKPLHEGTFVATREDIVIIQNPSGDFLSIELDSLSASGREWVDSRVNQIRRLNKLTQRTILAGLAAETSADASPYLSLMERSYGAFRPKVSTRSDSEFFYVESNSIPAHQMMVGITAWQQQVPIPQPYSGANAWQIPLQPRMATEPMSAKEHFFRGAIALAVNGIPIFNPIKNDGRTDTLLAGELDKWGGHCGRADDYHYHIAPTHLQAQVGPGNPVAFALDGYPVFGFTEPNGSPVGELDWMGGHTDKNGHYHYHATKTYPYLIGGFRGEVREVGGQVDPQPRAQGVRPYTRPLRGAKITDFTGDIASGYHLKYSQNGRDGFVNYKILDNDNVAFKFTDTSGRVTTETFEPRQRRGGRNGGDGEGRNTRRGDRRQGQGRDQTGQRPPRRGEDRPLPTRPNNRNEAQQSSQQSTRQPLQVAQNQDRIPQGNRRQGQGGIRGQNGGENRILSALDADNDGELSPQELNNAAIALRKLDKNGDGQLSRDETRGSGRGRNREGRPPAERGRTRSENPSGAPDATPFIIHPKQSGQFKLTSPVVGQNGPLPKEYNGDGEGATLPLEWTGTPTGTKSFAIVMDHLARGPEIKCYWTLWDIPASVTSLPKNVQGIGKLGATWKRGQTYVPPHSQGGGAKTYTLHIYALSTIPQFDQSPQQVTREILLATIKDSILDSATLNVIYTANGVGENSQAGKPRGKNRNQKPLRP